MATSVAMTNANNQLVLDFDGATFDRERDGERLGRQMEAVKRLMLDGQWRTLADIADYAQGSEAACSARLRDLRKIRYGCFVVHRRYKANGVWEYRVEP